MLTAILIIQCLLLIFMLVIGIEVAKKSEKKDAPPGSIPKEMLTTFKEASQQTWMAITISLYKMWQELDILDFDSLQSQLQKTLNELTANPQDFEEWSQKFNEYMKEKHNGPNK